MSTIAKKRSIFSVLFSSQIDVKEYEYDDVVLPTELQEALIDIEKKEEEVKKGFNSGKPSNGGFAKKINPDALDKKVEPMRKKYGETVVKNKAENKKTDYEIGD